MPWLYVRVLLTLVSGNFENSDNEPTCEMWSLIVNSEWWTLKPTACSDAWYTSCGQQSSFIELWDELCKSNIHWRQCQNSCRIPKLGSRWGEKEVKMSSLRPCEGAFGTTKPAWGRQSGLKADLTSSDKAFWDPFGLHFGTFFVSFLHLSFSMIFSTFWGRFGGPSQPQKLVFR